MDPVTLAFVSLVGFLGLGLLWFRVVRPILTDFGLFGGERVSTVYDDEPAPARAYVTSGAPSNYHTGAISAGGKAETEKAAEIETPRNAPVASPALDVNALRHEARAAALGALLAHGLIVPGKRTEAMRAVFGKVSGDAYTRAAAAVKRHEQQVLATLPPVEAVEPEAPRLIPVNGGKEGYIEL